MEFKGTKEIAIKKANQVYPCDIWGSDFDTRNKNTGFINGYLQSLNDYKSIELIDELRTDVDQLEEWIEWLKDLETNEKYVGITETMKKCIAVKKELIK